MNKMHGDINPHTFSIVLDPTPDSHLITHKGTKEQLLDPEGISYS